MQNPMQYYTNQSSDITDKKSNKTIRTDAIKDEQYRLSSYIASITGYAQLKKKLVEWGDRHAIYTVRKKAGLKMGSYLPEILVIKGAGDKFALARHVAGYLKTANMVNTNEVSTYDVNKLICHYVDDTKKKINGIFDDNKSCIINFIGFDQLVDNPRPPIADWHDWSDIILNYILDNIEQARFAHPVVFHVSNCNWLVLKNMHPRLLTFDTEFIKNELLSADSMAEITRERFQRNGFIFQKNIRGKLVAIFSEALKNPDIRQFPEWAIRHTLYQNILEQQARRLQKKSDEELTSRRIKTIIASDIPQNIVIGGNEVMYY